MENKKYGLFGRGTAFLGPEIEDADKKLYEISTTIEGESARELRIGRKQYYRQDKAYIKWANLKIEQAGRIILFGAVETAVALVAWVNFVK